MKSQAVVVASLALSVLTARAETPDFYADRIMSDGVGYIDTAYKYRVSGYPGVPKTSKVACRYQTTTHGKGELPGPYVSKDARTVFGYIENSTSRSSVRYSALVGSWGYIFFKGTQTQRTYGVSGENSCTIDYLTSTATWNSVTIDAAACEVDAGSSYYLCAYHDPNPVYSLPSVIELEEFQIYESSDGTSHTLVHRFVPCFKNGRPAVYDSITEQIIYPSTEGFALIGYDISLASGASVQVNAKDAFPRTLTLADGAELVFDGRTTLTPAADAVLPATGTVSISLPVNTGRGRYVLLKNLPEGWELSKFTLGVMPKGHVGTLTKSGDELVLTLATVTRSEGLPEGLAETLASDGVGFVDTGYRYRAASVPRTSRVVCDFAAVQFGKGMEPGPTITTNPRTVFGFADSDNLRSVARYTGAKGEFLYCGGSTNFWNNGGETRVEIDYLANTSLWKLATEQWSCRDIIAPTGDAASNYCVFANGAVPRNPVVITLRRFSVYESSDGVSEALAHDFVPCVNGGRYGLCDLLGESMHMVQGDTGRFSVDNVKWRLSVGGETCYLAGGESVTSEAAEACDGWLLKRDLDGRVLAAGAGAVAGFVMPECAASVVWTSDAAVGPGETMEVDSGLSAATLTLGAGSRLSFASDGALLVSSGLVLPEDGVVEISRAGLTAAGTYDLIGGLSGSVPLSAFAVVSLPDGLAGTVEQHGNRLVLRVTGVASETAALPDKIFDELTGDGAGYFDTGYSYHGSSFPKTARIVCDFRGFNWGSGIAPGPTTTNSVRAIFGYQESNSANVSFFRYSSGRAHVFYRSGNQSAYNGNGVSVAEINYLDNTAYWHWKSAAEDEGVYFNDVLAPLEDGNLTYFLMANHCYNSSLVNPSIIGFRQLRIFETTDGTTETLARSFVPARKDGRYCIYDTVTKSLAYVQNDTNCFSSAGAKWPAEIYALPIAQDFAYVRTTSVRPVVVPAFAPETSYTFVADGALTMKVPADRILVTCYDANNAVLSSTVRENVLRGDACTVVVGAAEKAVVTLEGLYADPEQIRQDLEIASVTGGARTMLRKTGRRSYELMVSADAELTFIADIASIAADSYDASGSLISSETLAGGLLSGSVLGVSVTECAYRILRVDLTPPRSNSDPALNEC